MSSHPFFIQEQSVPRQIVAKFATEHYPHLALEDKMLEQLSWLQTNSVITSQSNASTVEVPVNIEVRRSLSRYNSFERLVAGRSTDHSQFVEAQATSLSEEALLTKQNFESLSQHIQQLPKTSKNCLMATCFITKSDEAINSIPESNRKQLPADSEQFITHMVTNHPKVFPVCALLTKESIDLLPFAFYKNSHARQILDMEGGYNMIASIKSAIEQGEITHEHYNLWFARWIINIAGLDGHLNHQGSIYLTNPVAECILALKQELDQLWFDNKHPVIDNYLAFRRSKLDVDDKYTAYLGALMRQSSPEIGAQIQKWFKGLDIKEQEEKKRLFEEQLHQVKITPTYKPTVLVNLIQLGVNLSDALTIFTDIEAKANAIYALSVMQQEISINTPLCYRNIAYKEFLTPLKDYYERNKQVPELIINKDGYLSFSAESLQKNISTVSI